MRPLCSVCNRNPRAILNYRYGRVYYRSKCNSCDRKNRKLTPQKPKYELAGYKMKRECDLCGFKGKLARQFLVYHRNGNLNDCTLNNLRTVCHNCRIELEYNESTWATE